MSKTRFLFQASLALCALQLALLPATLAQTPETQIPTFTAAPNTTSPTEGLAPTESLAASALPTSEPLAPPLTPPSADSYRAEWARKSVQILQEQGIQLPSVVDYRQLMPRDSFLLLLARITAMPQGSLQAYVNTLPPPPDPAHINRGEAIQLVVQAFGLGNSLQQFAQMDSKFSDISREHPAYAAIVMAENTRLINGYPDRTIRPDEVLSWGEALIMIETVYSWRKALPTEAPEWVRMYQRRQNIWYQLADGFRLMLTLVYAALAIFFLVRTLRKSRRERSNPFRSLSGLLVIVTALLAIMWVNDILFNYQLIPREVYQIGAMLSIFAGLALLKTSTHMDEKASEPKPQAVIDRALVDGINREKGELFITDQLTNTRSMVLVNPETKIYQREGGKQGKAFFSEIQAGDIISVDGSRHLDSSIVEAGKMMILEQQQAQAKEQTQAINYQQQETQQKQANRLHIKPPKSHKKHKKHG
jgi:hypothetical protein